MTKVTQAFIQRQKTNGKFQRWDVDGVRGLKLVMHHTGGLSWTFRYSYQAGGKRVFKTATLGRWPDLSPEMAMDRAEILRGILKKGGDPSAMAAPEPKVEEKEAHRAVPLDPNAKYKPGTYAELVEKFIEEWVIPRNSISYAKQQRWKADKFVLPTLGRMKMEAVNMVVITKFLDEIAKTSVVNCNRTWTLLNKMHGWGQRRFNVLHDKPNPCQGYERQAEETDVRRLTEDEICRVGEAFRVSHDPRRFPAVFQLLTGCRRGALLCLGQATVHRDAKVIEWPEKTQGMKLTTKVYVPTSAWPIFDKLPKKITPTILQKAWERLRSAAKVDGSGHDLRRTFNSVGADLGISEYIINTLTHSGGNSDKLVKIYQIIGEVKLLETAETIGEHIAGLLGIVAPKPGQAVQVQAASGEADERLPLRDPAQPSAPMPSLAAKTKQPKKLVTPDVDIIISCGHPPLPRRGGRGPVTVGTEEYLLSDRASQIGASTTKSQVTDTKDTTKAQD